MTDYNAYDREHALIGANSLWFWHMSCLSSPGFVGYSDPTPISEWQRNPAAIFENLSQWDDDELNAPGFGMWFRVSVDSLGGWWDKEYQGVYSKVQLAFREQEQLRR